MESDTEDQVLLSLIVMHLIMDFDSRVGQLPPPKKREKTKGPLLYVLVTFPFYSPMMSQSIRSPSSFLVSKESV